MSPGNDHFQLEKTNDPVERLQQSQYLKETRFRSTPSILRRRKHCEREGPRRPAEEQTHMSDQSRLKFYTTPGHVVSHLGYFQLNTTELFMNKSCACVA